MASRQLRFRFFRIPYDVSTVTLSIVATSYDLSTVACSMVVLTYDLSTAAISIVRIV